MNGYVRNMHTKSGLLNDIKGGISIEDVDNSMADILKDFKDKIILHGNSIHFDRGFINNYLPKTASKLNYRMIDVSSFKECLKIYNVGITPTKKEVHRATDDIKESISEYKYYLGLLNIYR
jgi:oligoribonuclease